MCENENRSLHIKCNSEKWSNGEFDWKWQITIHKSQSRRILLCKSCASFLSLSSWHKNKFKCKTQRCTTTVKRSHKIPKLRKLNFFRRSALLVFIQFNSVNMWARFQLSLSPNTVCMLSSVLQNYCCLVLCTAYRIKRNPVCDCDCDCDSQRNAFSISYKMGKFPFAIR